MPVIDSPLPTGVAVLHEDDHILALHKASGVLSHPAGPDAGPSLLDTLGPDLHLLHRLDRGTSGVLLLAKGPEVAAQLGAAFAEGKVEKRYVALVVGAAHNKGVVRRPLRIDGVDYDALTRFRRMEQMRVERWMLSLLLVRPASGRMHQIRRHLAGIGLPLLGDERYGDRRANRELARLLDFDRLFLHAASVTFPHPSDGQKRTLTSGMAPELCSLLEDFDVEGRILLRWAREPRAPEQLPRGPGSGEA